MKIVLLDIDQTLLKAPEEANRDASGVMFRTVFNQEVDEGSINNVGMTEMGIIRAVLEKARGGSVEQEPSPIEVPEEAYKVWGDAAREAMRIKPATVLPGVKEFLDELVKDKEVKLGLLSGNSPWRAEAKLVSAGLDHYFRDESGQLLGAFGNESEIRDNLIEIAKDRLGRPGDKAVLVDDSLIGAEMAKRHNVLAIMVATGSASVEVLSQHVPHVFSDFGEGRGREAANIIKTL